MWIGIISRGLLPMRDARPEPTANPSRVIDPQRTSPLRTVARRFSDRSPVSFAGYAAADALHIPGDTTTPPAPDAIPIGTGDA